MQRFQFRLESLLRLRQQRERMGELRRQKAKLALEGVRTRIAGLTEELAAVARSLHGGGVPANRWLAAYAHAERLGRAILAAEAEAVQAERLLHEATVELVRLTQDVETLEHLREHAWQAHKDDAAAAEQQRLDDLGVRRWQAARGDRTSSPEGERA